MLSCHGNNILDTHYALILDLFNAPTDPDFSGFIQINGLLKFIQIFSSAFCHFEDHHPDLWLLSRIIQIFAILSRICTKDLEFDKTSRCNFLKIPLRGAIKFFFRCAQLDFT